MGKPVLLLRLEAPWQSWGTRSRWDVRDTAREPTKCGIIGLLACALGYPRCDLRIEQLQNALRFGVRVEQPGKIVEDFQTITDYLPTAEGKYKSSGRNGDGTPGPATILSPRFYIEDGAFLVAVEALPGYAELLEQCAEAVQKPRWPLFLGRKACVPTRPVFDVFTTRYGGVEEALRSHPWSWLRECLANADDSPETPGVPRQLDVYLERSENTTGPGCSVRRDAVRINPSRVYGFCTIEHLRIERPPVPTGNAS